MINFNKTYNGNCLHNFFVNAESSLLYQINKPKNQTMKALFFILLVTTIIFAACRKNASSDNTSFDQMAAKEWYYGVFKKSSEWLGYNRQKNGIKLPDWRNGKYFKVGNSEFVEFPLIKAKTKMGITSKANLSAGDALKIANSSLSRIVFAKTGGKITVREIDYVPDWDYLSSAKFDISDNYFAKMNKNFTGKLIFKTWGGVELSQNLLNNGKIVGKIDKRNIASNLRVQACEDFLIIIYERNCYTVTNGDVLTTECTDWVETDRWIEPVCDTDPECEGLTPIECACMLFGCNDPDNPNGVDEACNNSLNEFVQNNNVVESAETDNITISSSGPIERVKKYSWIFAKGTFNTGLKWKSWETGVHKKINNEWRWESLTHDFTTQDGTTFGGTLTLAVNAADTYVAVYNAGVNLNYTFTHSVVCSGSPLSSTNTKTSYKTFNVND